MKSLWSEKGLEELKCHIGDAYGQGMADRLYTARLIGQEPTLVLHGGGNVSIKGTLRSLYREFIEVVYVKASGADLASLGMDDLPALELAPLRQMRQLESVVDDAMVNEFRKSLCDSAGPTPSIETLLHAFLPSRFIDHSHADAVLTLTNRPNGEQLIAEALGDRVAILPYVKPGFELARIVSDAYESNPIIEGIVLLHHGLVTFGEDAKTSYENHVSLVTACEDFIRKRKNGRSIVATAKFDDSPEELADRVAPILRGLLAEKSSDEDQPHLRKIFDWRHSAEIMAIVNSREAQEIASSGALTGDHVIRTGPNWLYIDAPNWDDNDALRCQLEQGIRDYCEHHKAQLLRSTEADPNDSAMPRVVILPGAGVFCWGNSRKDAGITADVVEQSLRVKADAMLIGEYRSLPMDHLVDMECRALQRKKIKSIDALPLAGQVVAISGGAGAIGAAVACVCAQAGAHVAVTDLDETRISHTVEIVNKKAGANLAMGVVMDVTDESSVKRGFQDIVRAFGGVDVAVCNAGIAHVSSIDMMDVTEFRRVMEINTTGYLLFMREGTRIMKRQGLGGHVIVNASKNVFAPGKDFAAYSASKAAGHQLGKVAAMELAPFGIRVNMINADAIFGDKSIPSGLWQDVGPDRAQSRDLSVEALPEYYQSRNLLKAKVQGHHVGNAVVFFASNATPTTGATLPVDGGVVGAFPR